MTYGRKKIATKQCVDKRSKEGVNTFIITRRVNRVSYTYGIFYSATFKLLYEGNNRFLQSYFVFFFLSLFVRKRPVYDLYTTRRVTHKPRHVFVGGKRPQGRVGGGYLIARNTHTVAFYQRTAVRA